MLERLIEKFYGISIVLEIVKMFFTRMHKHIISDEGTFDGTKLWVSGAGGALDKGESAGFLILEGTPN